MKQLHIFIASFLLSLTSFAGPMIDIQNDDQLQTYLKTKSFNGVVKVVKGDQVLLREAFGYKNLETKTPLRPDDLLQIGSNTKQFIAAAILKLQQEKKLSLEDEIVKYLPEYAERFKGIKIKDVLNHTSGITNYTDHKDFWTLHPPTTSLSLKDILDYAVQFELDFEPRTNWNYSNTGYIVAGRILETVSAKKWDQYLSENFFSSLKMQNTNYVELFNTVSDVTGYERDGQQLVAIDDFNLSWALSAGALYSNVDDMIRWTDIYDNSAILSDDSKTQMGTPFLNNYGLGINAYNVDNIAAGEVMYSHGGKTPGFVSELIYLKKTKLKIVTLSNANTGVIKPGMMLLEFFLKGKTQVVKSNDYDMSVEQLKEFVGHYSAEDLSVDIYFENGRLFLKTSDNQPPYPLKPVDKDSFNLLGFAGEEFIRDSTGRIVAIKHYQGGGVSLFTKSQQNNDAKKESKSPNKFPLLKTDF